MAITNNLKLVIIFNTLAFTFAPNSSQPIQEGGESLVRTTKSGSLEGITELTRVGQTVVSFYGIPYAKPPVGDLRFKPPEPVQPWTGVLDAKSVPPPCYQQYRPGRRKQLKSSNRLLPRPWSEDCLKLNIWIANTTDPEQPVIVYFHSGGFSFGSGTSSALVDNTFAVLTKTVFVTVNYRLGAFGFLFTSDPNAPGNAGLLDQQMALKWVSQNIEVFSGKRRATFIMGDKAGGASVGYHVMSKGSYGLFVTAALFRGAPNCHWAYVEPEDSLKTTKSLADNLGCKSDNSTTMISCLRAKHPEDIVSAAVGADLKFKPTVDGSFITEPPIDALRSNRISNITTAMSTFPDEGSLYLLDRNLDILTTQDGRLSRFNFRRVVKRLIPDIDDVTMRAVEVQYLKGSNLDDPIMLRDAAREIYADYQTDACSNEYAHLVAANGHNVIRGIIGMDMSKPRDWMGAVSAADCWKGYALLGEKLGFSQNQQRACGVLSHIMTHAVRQKIGDLLKQFPPYSIVDKNYVIAGMGENVVEFGNNYKVAQTAFWEKLRNK